MTTAQTSSAKAGREAMNSVSATEIGRIARGKCRARTSERLPVIDFAPRVTTEEVKANITTPMPRKPTKLLTPSRVPSSNPKMTK